MQYQLTKRVLTPKSSLSSYIFNLFYRMLMRRGCPRITALWSLWLLTCQLIELIIHSYSMQTFIHTKNHQIEHSYNFAINFDLQHFAAMLRVHKSLFSDDKFSSEERSKWVWSKMGSGAKGIWKGRSSLSLPQVKFLNTKLHNHPFTVAACCITRHTWA